MTLRKPTITRRTGARKRWVWLGTILLLASAGAAWYLLRDSSLPGAQTAVQGESVAQTSSVQRGDIQITVSGSGTLVASQTVDLSFSTGGTVIELNVGVGDTVQPGDVLARLGNADDLEAALASAQLGLLEAQGALDDLQDNAGLSLAQSYQDLLAAQEKYANALAESQRMDGRRCSQEVTARYASQAERLEQKLASFNTVDIGSDAWINAKSDYATAAANYTYCASYTDQEKLVAESSLEIHALELHQAETRYNTLKKASGIDPEALEMAQAKLNEAEKKLLDAQENLDGIVLTAPIEGKITYLAAKAGAVVDTGKYITISDVSHPRLTVSMDENDAAQFKVGSKALVTFDVLPDQVFNGTVIEVNPSLVSSGMYRVVQGVVELDEAAARTVQDLLLGLNASVAVVSDEASDVLIVPAAALQEQVDGTYRVMVVDSSGAIAPRTVEVGLIDSANAEVTSGLAEGDMVRNGGSIARPSDTSSNDEEEQPFDGMMPPDGGMPPGGGMVPPGG